MKNLNVMVILAIATLSSLALASGGGGSKETKKAVVEATPSESHQLMETGKKQIAAKDWSSAVATFKKATEVDAKNADAFNYLAYSTRKSGKPADALPIYEKALQLDPKHLGALEYQGEAYLELKRVADAQKNLDKIKAICGIKCEQYVDLESAIKTVKK